MPQWNSVRDLFQKGEETRKERRLRQRNEEQGGERVTGFHHSSSYHDFFEGYSERIVVNKKGRNRIIREYVGKYYVQDCSDKKWKLCKVALIVLYVAAAALFLLGISQRTKSNAVLMTAVPGMATMILFFLLLYHIILYTVAPRKMTAYDYHSGPQKMFLFAVITGACACATALAVTVYALYAQSDNLFAELSPLPGCFAAAACMAGLAVMAKTMKFRLEKNEKAISENAVVIE